MIVSKILLLLPTLLLLVNAQGGGRFGYFGRPDFRRPRPWHRPQVVPTSSTSVPITKVTDSSKASTDLYTIPPVRSSSVAPASSPPRLVQRGRVWARPVFRPRPTVISTPKAITEKTENYSPVTSVVSSTTVSESYTNTPSTKIPFVDNHIKYNNPNYFNPYGRDQPKITHNAEEIPSESKTTVTEPKTEKVTEFYREPITTPVELFTPTSSSTTTTTTTTTTTEYVEISKTTTKAPFINSDVNYNESLNSNFGIRFPTEASLHLNENTYESNTTPVHITTPRGTVISTQTSNFNSRTRYPPYMSHNVPTNTIQPQQIPDDNSKTSATTIPASEKPSTTTESAKYTVPSTNVPFVDDHKKYEDIYIKANTPIPFAISKTEASSTTTERLYPVYKPNDDEINKSVSEQSLKATSDAGPVGTKEPKDYIMTSSKPPFIDIHNEYDGDFISHSHIGSMEYTNVYDKAGDIPPKSDDYNSQVYPVYDHNNDKVSNYESSSPATEPEIHTQVTPIQIPFIDEHKTYDDGYSSSETKIYINGDDKTNAGGNEEFVQNIYRYNNYKDNKYGRTWTPKFVSTTKSSLSKRYPQSTTKQPPKTQTTRQTKSYGNDVFTEKPTTRYYTSTTTTTTTTTKRPIQKNKAYDIDNFKCKTEDGYYSIVNQCDDFIECKSGNPVQITCPDGLHFNPAARYPEFPCAYPSEVKCESNSVIREPEPTSDCPRRYGYFSMKNGNCDKYIMCQEGLATVMSCPAGLAFSEATSSCDWPANVPNCLPDVFQGFTCPEPELNEDGEPIRSIWKYRYNKSCKQYVACQKGHPRLLSCDSGLSFDQNTESCVNDIDVTDCT